MSNSPGAVPSIIQTAVTQPLLQTEAAARLSSPKLKRQLLPLGATNSFSKSAID